MIAILKGVLGKIWGYVLLAGVLLASLVTLRQSGKSIGRAEVEAEMRKRDDKAKRQADDVARKVDRLDDVSLADEFDRLYNDRRRR